MIPGLQFLTGPLGRVAMVGLALVAWTLYQRDQAADRAREMCQAEQLRQTIAEISRQKDVARKALENSRQRADQTQKKLDELERERAQITADSIEDDPVKCVIPDSSIERLRRIR